MAKRKVSNQLSDPRIERLEQERQESLKLSLTLESLGWKEIVQPMVDLMIQDTIGCKKGNHWDTGIVGTKKEDERYSVEYLLAYRQALIDLNNRLWDKAARKEKVDQEIKRITKSLQVVKTDSVVTSRYAPENKTGWDATI